MFRYDMSAFLPIKPPGGVHVISLKNSCAKSKSVTNIANLMPNYFILMNILYDFRTNSLTKFKLLWYALKNLNILLNYKLNTFLKCFLTGVLFENFGYLQKT